MYILNFICFFFLLLYPAILNNDKSIEARQASSALERIEIIHDIAHSEQPASGEKAKYLFVPNQHQWDSRVHFRADIPGGKLFLTKKGFTYAFYDGHAFHRHDNLPSNHTPINHDANEGANHKKAPSPSQKMVQMHALEVEFLNANPDVRISGKSGSASTSYSFFTGNDPSRWASGLKAAEEVTYSEIYQKTDLKMYSSDDGLKYDLALKPGADPDDIAIQYKGAESLVIKDGNLIVTTSLQNVTEQAPVAYQYNGKSKVFVTCRFLLDGDILKFAFPDGYNKKLPLIIDPLLIFSTFSGSSADNWGYTATYDDGGNVYTGGIVFNFGFPTTAGAYQTYFAGNIDIGIMKFDSTGARLLYSTYLGGSNAEAPHSMIVNGLGELIIYGTSGSWNYPTSANAFNRVFNGGRFISPVPGVEYTQGSDMIISRLSGSGTQLLSSTFIGGTNNDGLMPQLLSLTKNYGDQFRGDVIVDNDNNVYVASNTSSADFPVENGVYATYGGGNLDGVVFKMSPDLSELIWSSYFGGPGDDAAYSIKLDTENNVIIGGGTTSNTNIVVSPDALRTMYSGRVDGFIAVIKNDGSEISNSTYLGTTEYDQVYFIDLGPDGNIYALGQTLGNYPVTSGTFYNPNSRHFLHKLNKDLTETLFSTVFGAGGQITPIAFLVNECENIFISGWGGSINATRDVDNNPTGYIGGNTFNMPLTPDAFQPTTDGSDFYLMALEKDASSLLYATYFGGRGTFEHVDGGTSRFDKRGIVYQAVCAGCGNSSEFPTTPGVWSSENNSSNCNNAAFKFDLATLKADFVTNSLALDKEGLSKGCSPLPVLFQNRSIGGKTFEWDFGDGTISTLEDNVVHTYENPGTYTVTLKAVDEKTCKKVDYAYGTIRVFEPHFSMGEDVAICYGESTRLSSGGGVSYTWSPAYGLSSTNVPNPVASPRETTTYTLYVVDKNECEFMDSVVVTVVPEIVADFTYSIINGCESLPVVQFFNKSSGFEGLIWDFGDGTTSTEESPVHQYNEAGNYKISLRAATQMCEVVKEVTLPLVLFNIPNVFSPNDDSVNDFFEIASNLQVNLSIYNRWGKLIFSKENYQNEWNAQGLPTGIYFYEASLPDNTVCKGWLQVLR